MQKDSKRLFILSRSEIQKLYDFPIFNIAEQHEYFTMNAQERKMAFSHHKLSAKIYFILQLGYFKAKKSFFKLTDTKIASDIKYILNSCFTNMDKIKIKEIPQSTRIDQQNRILTLLGYQKYTNKIKNILTNKAKQLITIDTNPIYLFRNLIDFLTQNKVVFPVYSYMQDIIGKIITDEKRRLISIAKTSIFEDVDKKLNDFLSTKNSKNNLINLKKKPKNFKFNEIKGEIEKRQAIQSLYEFSTTFLSKLKISNESIKYYASLIEYYSLYRLSLLELYLSYIYLLCFINIQFKRINDNLVNTFIFKIRKYINDAKEHAKENVYNQKNENNENTKKIGKILDLFVDNDISDGINFGEIRSRAFKILEKTKFYSTSAFLKNKNFIDEKTFEWNYYYSFSTTYKKNLRALILNLDFESQKQNDELLKILFQFKNFINQKISISRNIHKLSKRIIPDKLKKYLFDIDDDNHKHLNVNKYEFFIYMLLRNRLESGDIFIKNSINFRSLEDDLISLEKWKKKEKIINELNLRELNNPIEEQLNLFENKLDSRIKSVNNRILSGDNKFIKIKGNKWNLSYESNNNKIIKNPFFTQLPKINIGNLIHFVNEECNFLKAFTNILKRYGKIKKDECSIIAAIIANGTNIRLLRMSEISDINYQSLSIAENNFIRLETVKLANDIICNKMTKLQIFKYFNIENGIIHSSSDGQKRETGIDTFNSRYSPKYFGLKKGVTSYTLLANNIPINTKIIGANEHESHYVFDILYNNSTEIIPKIHSTDTHGMNKINFALLHIFGYQFAPRCKSIHIRKNIIHSFEHPNNYQHYIIKSNRKINKKLILDEWDNIQRIIASLALKTTTQSIIVRKLSSYSRKNRTKQALWEYNNILQSLHNLKYIDSIFYRQNIQTALNRGESYNQLLKSIPYADGGKFRVKNEEEQKVLNECSRLIANCIIYYNAIILSKLLKISNNTDIFKRISPIAWQHINLYGKYEFNKPINKIDIDDLLSSLDIISLSNSA